MNIHDVVVTFSTKIKKKKNSTLAIYTMLWKLQENKHVIY